MLVCVINLRIFSANVEFRYSVTLFSIRIAGFSVKSWIRESILSFFGETGLAPFASSFYGSFSKILPKIPEICNLVLFHHSLIFSKHILSASYSPFTAHFFDLLQRINNTTSPMSINPIFAFSLESCSNLPRSIRRLLIELPRVEHASLSR